MEIRQQDADFVARMNNHSGILYTSLQFLRPSAMVAQNKLAENCKSA
jgi:hypothetical protein